MTLSPEAARTLLGLATPANSEQIDQSHGEQRKTVEERLSRAPTIALRRKYEEALAKIDAARELLLATANPAAPSLSATQFGDLPGAAPVHTVVDGVGAAKAPPANALKPGEILADRYEIRQRIGIGGMGAVYRAFDRNRSEEIAIKVLLPHLLTNATARDRFLAEAKIASKLSHPNIVNVHDVQRDGGKDFLTMELLRGQTLRQHMLAREAARQPFSVGEAVAIGKAIGSALAHAHRHTIHRDVKPENVWVEEDGQVKLMDFGIARVLSTSRFTMEATTMGTAYYMAPEQIKGASNIDHRADQYALAVMLYELIAGEIPAGRIKPLNVLNRKVPRGLSDAIDKALEPQASARYPDINAFVIALARTGGGFRTVWLGAAAAAVLIAAILLAFPIIRGLLPDGEATDRAKAVAIEAQGGIAEMLRRLDLRERELDNRVREARSGVDRLDGQVRMARSDAEKRELGDRLAEARAELALASEIHELAGLTIFVPTRIAQLRSRQALGEASLRDNNVIQAADVLGAARAELDAMLSGTDAIENALRRRNEAESWLERASAAITAENANPQQVLVVAIDHFQRGQQALSNGEFDQASGEFVSLREQLRVAFGAFAEEARAAHAQRARSLIAASKVSEAQAAINRGKALEQLQTELR